jgi:hypothetical protein
MIGFVKLTLRQLRMRVQYEHDALSPEQMSSLTAFTGDVTKKRRPTPAERDERVKVELPADEFIEGVLAAGEHPDEDENDEGPDK